MFNWESSNKIISFSQDKNKKNQAESIAADPQELQMLKKPVTDNKQITIVIDYYL